ncbi:alpha/beta hydrolase [Paenibacillus donghaensis]|uniref:alpha/beta fold hydrolase n=1 Tax=Paenibacillus donghaensis TaxID=414771 RepID=UPI0018836D83|nr:alpha/beta hydrolase [Paenibacillus donghaensis]MBE9917610.1 alpha/beta hydrolase [Paenibacillus donghaensis]
MIQVELHDGNSIDVMIRGEGPALLLPVNPIPMEGAQAEEMRKWGADPALGYTLIQALGAKYRVVAFDYEGHVLQAPKPDTLTSDNIASDFLSIADAAGLEHFAYYGYSWLALSGLQLAIRTERLAALVMGGFPPINGPYEQMLKVTEATHRMSIDAQNQNQNNPNPEKQTGEDIDWSNVEVSMNEKQTRQFATLYRHLRQFDDRQAQARLTCPRLCFAGSVDKIAYGEKWGNVLVDIASPLIHQEEELRQAGWDVRVLDGLDHTGAMQAKHVLPILMPWLDVNLSEQ